VSRRSDDAASVVIGGFIWCGLLALICWLKEVL